MARDWEQTFRQWSKPGSESEQERCENAVRMIREAVQQSRAFKGKTIEVFAQGSYRNGTNVRMDSDVDICVCSMDPFFTDFSMAQGFTKEDVGLTDSSYTYQQFKDAVEEALITKFGPSGVTRGNKAFDVHANTYRVDADGQSREHYPKPVPSSGMVILSIPLFISTKICPTQLSAASDVSMMNKSFLQLIHSNLCSPRGSL